MPFKKGNIPWNSGKEWSDEVKEKIRNALKGNAPWNTGKKLSKKHRENLSLSHIGYKMPDSQKKKIGESNSNEKHWNWRGNNVKYDALHQWVSRQKGKPEICENCGSTSDEKWLHWSNIDHKYNRNLNDYVSLCPQCHKRYDLDNGLCFH